MSTLDGKTVVALADIPPEYPSEPPFSPSETYPEYEFGPCGSGPNHVYRGVRECFRLAGLDAEGFGSPQWNPLGDLLRPGETVLLKPNLVKERHPRDPLGWQYVLTHGSVIRAVADYAWKAIGSRGRIDVADAPVTESSFEAIVRTLGLAQVRRFYEKQGLDLRLVDLRNEEWTTQQDVVVARRRLPGDPNGTVVFDLGGDSEFVGHGGEGRYFGADYDEGEVNRHHGDGRHEYLIAGTAVKANVVFSLPKLKTHRKAGITASLKNLVGINGEKNWLPHHTEGGPGEAGDEHPAPDVRHRLERGLVRRLRHVALRAPWIGPWVYRQARRFGRRVFGDSSEVVRSGNWWGNDTVWRMCLDLNKIILYGNPDGTLRPAGPDHRKRHFTLVDAVVAGEGRGPLDPDPFAAGMLVFGVSPPSVDAACACLMGFDPERIPIVRQAFRCQTYPLSDWDWPDVRLVSNRADWCGPLGSLSEVAAFRFRPHFGWVGHIERRSPMSCPTC